MDGDTDVWPSMESLNVYNPISLVAALRPTFVDHVLDAVLVPVRSAIHKIVGITLQSSGVRDAAALRGFICSCIFKVHWKRFCFFFFSCVEHLPVSHTKTLP